MKPIISNIALIIILLILSLNTYADNISNYPLIGTPAQVTDFIFVGDSSTTTVAARLLFSGDSGQCLRGDGTWDTCGSGSALPSGTNNQLLQNVSGTWTAVDSFNNFQLRMTSWDDWVWDSDSSNIVDDTKTDSVHLWTSSKVNTELGTKEDDLGNPSGNGYVLSSATDGTRSWVSRKATIHLLTADANILSDNMILGSLYALNTNANILIQLLAVTAGDTTTIVSLYANTITITPQSNMHFVFDNYVFADGVSLVSGGNIGDKIKITVLDSTTILATTLLGTWTASDGSICQ